MGRTRTTVGDPDLGPIRLAVVLSGAVALGTFEAGVVNELLAAVEHGAPITVDMAAGTSAGAIIAATVARSLLTGDPYGPGLRRWTEASLDFLTEFYERPSQARQRSKPVDVALLSSEVVRRMLRSVLVKGTAGVPFTPRYPAPRIALVMVTTNLDGLPGTGVAGDEYRYSESVTLTLHAPGEHAPLPREVWERICEITLASGAFPGAFDPVQIDWERRLNLPGQALEQWENGPLLEELNRRYPGLQARMRYCDGGLMDNQPLERAVGALTQLMGAPDEAGPESLIFDPRRVFILVEPDPPVTALEQISSGKPMGLIGTVGRALRLFTLASSPFNDRQRILAGNARIIRMLQFLALLGQRIREGYRPTADSREQLLQEWLVALREQKPAITSPGRTGGPGDEDEPGLIPRAQFAAAIPAFYEWLTDVERSEADLMYMERIGAARLAEEQQAIRDTLRVLREAYRSLWALDQADPGRYQRLLIDAHTTLAIDLGLNRPWVLLSYVAPEDPRLFLRGEEAIHFGGFFSREYLDHDFEVGRYYARTWLLQAVPDHVPSTPVERPVPSAEGISWRQIVDNWRPLRQMAGRVLSAVGWGALTPWERAAAMALGVGLTISAASSVLWAIALPLHWVTGRPDLLEAQTMLAIGGAVFPLILGTFLILMVPRGLYGELLRRGWDYLAHGPARRRRRRLQSRGA